MTEWPDTALPPQQVLLGSDTRARLHPHNGEFDFAAVLGGSLNYEREVFRFLDGRMKDYDAVVEIGANVGVFTLYFGKRLSESAGPERRVFAFEPSARAFSRLLLNVGVNDLPNVRLFNAALGTHTGIESFYEPSGHLTNGSFVSGFASRFSDSVAEVPVVMLDAGVLTKLIGPYQRVLFKIDVEGYESALLRALAPVIAAKRPDLLIEVLPEFEEDLERAVTQVAPGYVRYAISNAGLKKQNALSAHEGRDCFLASMEILQHS